MGLVFEVRDFVADRVILRGFSSAVCVSLRRLDGFAQRPGHLFRQSRDDFVDQFLAEFLRGFLAASWPWMAYRGWAGSCLDASLRGVSVNVTCSGSRPGVRRSSCTQAGSRARAMLVSYEFLYGNCLGIRIWSGIQADLANLFSGFRSSVTFRCLA
jgi:hypothetical protein